MTTPPLSELAPCPWCGNDLYRSPRPMNPKAYCRTLDCFGGKMPAVNLDSASDLAAYNRRPSPPALEAIRREAFEEAAEAAWAVITEDAAATYPEELAGHVGDAIRALKGQP